MDVTNTNASPAPAIPPAGWYGDPDNKGQERWWNGLNWSEHVRQVTPGAAARPPAPAAAEPTGQTTNRAARAGLRWSLIAVGITLLGMIFLFAGGFVAALAWMLWLGILLVVVSGLPSLAGLILGIIGAVRANRQGSIGVAVTAIVIGFLFMFTPLIAAGVAVAVAMRGQ